MKCRQCQHPFAIRTNPQERSFDYVGGLKRKMEEFDTVDAKSLGVIDTDYGHAIHNFRNGVIVDADVHSLQHAHASSSTGSTCTCAIDKLAKKIVGQRKAMTERDAMDILLKHNHSTMYDDASSNSKIRADYRVKRKAKKRRLNEAKSLGLGKGIELGDGKVEDVALSRLAFDRRDVTVRDEKCRLEEKLKFRRIRQGIFVSTGAGIGSNTAHRTSGSRSKSTIEAMRHERRNGSQLPLAPHDVSSFGSTTSIPKQKTPIIISVHNGKVSTEASASTKTAIVNNDRGDMTVVSEKGDHPPEASSSLLALEGYGSDSCSE